MGGKYLIVNADDFGIDAQINQGIAYCCRYGIVRSVSLVAPGQKFDHALDLIKDLPHIGVGVHLCLVAERPLLPAAALQSLVDNNGNFHADCFKFVIKLCQRKVNLQEVELELEAQIRKVLERGIKPTHVDSHQYMHLIPGILEIVIKLSVKYGIKWVRYPAGLKDGFGFTLTGAYKKAWLLFFAGAHVRVIRAQELHVPEHSYGFQEGGRLDKVKLTDYLSHMGEGINDLTSHPGYLPEHVSYQRWHYQWARELGALTDPDILQWVKSLGLRLVNYAF